MSTSSPTAVVAALVVCALATVGTAAAAPHAGSAATGPCELYAPSKATIERILGAAEQEPIDSGTFCYIEGKSAQTRIYPSPASKARERMALDLTVYGTSRVTKTHPAHLGKGATLVRPAKGHGQIDLFFKKGRHFFTLTGDGATPLQMVQLGRAVYAKA